MDGLSLIGVQQDVKREERACAPFHRIDDAGEEAPVRDRQNEAVADAYYEDEERTRLDDCASVEHCDDSEAGEAAGDIGC